MGLLEKLGFGKKKFKPTNRFEELLLEAADNPGARGDFLRQMFHFDVLVIAKLKKGEDGRETILVPQNQEGKETLRVFTSKAALEESIARANLGEMPFVGMSLLNLFKMAAGRRSDVVLNPGLEFGKTFLSTEIERILSNQGAHEHTIKPDQDIKVGQPPSYPNGFLEALKSVLKYEPRIKGFFVGLQLIDNTDKSYRIAIDVEPNITSSDTKEIFHKVAAALSDLSMQIPFDLKIATNEDREMAKGDYLKIIQR